MNIVENMEVDWESSSRGGVELRIKENMEILDSFYACIYIFPFFL